MHDITIQALFDLEQTIARDLLERYVYPWEALAALADYITELGKTLPADRYAQVAERVWIAHSAKVAPSASISGPCIIDENAEICHCAYIRPSVIVGCGAKVGNSTELKNCILFNRVQVPHFNFVGDSILGYRAHMGASAITSNFKGDGSNITVRVGDGYPTGRRKLGAMIGDFGEIGCGAVLNPGTVIGRRGWVYPLVSVRGMVPADHICKAADVIVPRAQKNND
ncbi:MAG: UDP-N-acetylglucosamine pyrophosphorylase [Clostridia bacterium]|nr:UDP-N-acetylglucosamine pyrophosphorylase [Clostridia bacterium]